MDDKNITLTVPFVEFRKMVNELNRLKSRTPEYERLRELSRNARTATFFHDDKKLKMWSEEYDEKLTLYLDEIDKQARIYEEMSLIRILIYKMKKRRERKRISENDG